MNRVALTGTERVVLDRLRALALSEAHQSPGVASERRRIAEWIEQTAFEGWLPAVDAQVWREGGRIRRADGTGYGDMVTDEQIEQHIADDDGSDPRFVPFARATLDLRVTERQNAAHDTKEGQ